MNRYPEMIQVEQSLHQQPVASIDGATKNTLHQWVGRHGDRDGPIQPGQRVAIAVGSRGVANLAEIVSSVVGFCRDRGAVPIIVPAMGSHGGASADGQQRVLASLGITESSVECPIESSMETVSLGKTQAGFDVRFDRIAAHADHVVVVNRVKPHTRLIGSLQSGLIKMMLIGLGNHDGAAAYHSLFPSHQYRLDAIATEITDLIIAKTPVTMGLAIIEDGAEQTSHIEAVAAEDFLTREPELLKIATERMPSLPFDSADLLIINRIGKEISGTGMDTNIVGRKWNDNIAAADEWPKISGIYVRNLSEKTAGNATGIGVAEYCHQNVVDAMDAEMTKTNCIASAHPTGGRIPLTFHSDQEALDAILSQYRTTSPANMKWIAIEDTLSLSRFFCSTAFQDQLRSHERLHQLCDPAAIEFDDAGNMMNIF
ncbi:hypothetical protein LF1_43480 [Rubripirellula obstinata]|uniref:LarA-like N-terminal domain-containing protein n=1 Tax=Rubripirellula obstinata TaxID=406547 RepID=A0A5B1CL43_9BACT|nr:lactate racemase domain-containing protein [Rubripirellula obstinata]KAA1261788.1 hypothetical protein LF1_43480 [Rubripirellula obstinata]